MGLGGEITKAEYFREHAEFLRAIALCLRRDDANRTRLLNMSDYFEDMAKAAESETRSSLANEACNLKKQSLARGPRRTRGSVTVDRQVPR